jgi:hypothetical protein
MKPRADDECPASDLPPDLGRYCFSLRGKCMETHRRVVLDRDKIELTQTPAKTE